MPLGMEVGLGPDDIVRWGHSCPPPKKEHSPQFSAMSIVAKRLSFGTEVGLSLGNIVLDGDPASPPLKEHSP